MTDPGVSPPAARRSRGWAVLGRAALWIVLLLTVVELSLRGVGWYLLRSRARALEQSLPAGAYRMLFIGESTTYGLFVEPDQAYPARVAALLEAKHPGRRFLSFNRGVPGLTTTAMLRTLPEKLQILSPQLVVILAGANDFHTQYNGVRIPGDGWLPRPIGYAVGTLRIYRLIDLWLELRKPKRGLSKGEWLDERSPSGVKLEQSEIFYDLGSGHHLLYPLQPGEEALVSSLTAKLEANLERMIEQCRAAGAQVVLVGYLRSPIENAMIERVANRVGVPFVATWRDPGDTHQPPLDLFTPDGFHPSVAGHQLMAERIVERIDLIAR